MKSARAAVFLVCLVFSVFAEDFQDLSRASRRIGQLEVILERRWLIDCKRLNFDRLDGGRVKRYAKPVTVRRAIWPG